MLYKWLSLLVMLPSTYFTAAFVGIPVPLRKRQRFPILVTLSNALLWILNHFILPAPSILVDVSMSLSAYALLFHYAPKSQRFNAFLAQTLLYLGMVAGSFLTMNITLRIRKFLGMELYTLQMVDTPLHVVGSLICTVFLFPFLYLCAKGIRKLLAGGYLSPRFLSFLIIPFSQFTLLNIAVQYAFRYSAYVEEFHFAGDVVLALIMNMAADIAFLLLYRRFRKAELMKLSMEQARQQLDVQNDYYRELQKSILSVNQIRHDLNNQLQATYTLLHEGHPELVEQQLEQLGSSIRSRVGTRYCENMMVDAILSAKADQCRRIGCKADISVFLPAELPIENAHLCSLFANLMDNSIQALKEQGSGTLTLRAELHGRMLTAVCENPSLPPAKKSRNQDLLRRHGLGLDILKRLTEIYGGHLDTVYQDGIFSASILLQLPEQAEDTLG